MRADVTIQLERRGTSWGHKISDSGKAANANGHTRFGAGGGIRLSVRAILVSRRRECDGFRGTRLIHQNGRRPGETDF